MVSILRFHDSTPIPSFYGPGVVNKFMLTTLFLVRHPQRVPVSFFFLDGPPKSSPVLPSSLLLIEYVAATAVEHDVDNAIQRKDKQSLPIPVRPEQVAGCV